MDTITVRESIPHNIQNYQDEVYIAYLKVIKKVLDSKFGFNIKGSQYHSLKNLKHSQVIRLVQSLCNPHRCSKGQIPVIEIPLFIRLNFSALPCFGSRGEHKVRLGTP